MNLAAIDWLSISIDLLKVVFVIVCFLMILLVLMQRPKQEGLGAAFGAGVTDQVFGARTTNVLQRGTVYLATMFFLLSLILAVLIGHKNKKVSMKHPDPPKAQVEQAKPDKTENKGANPNALSDGPSQENTTPAKPETPATTPATPAKPETPATTPDTPAKPETPAETPAKDKTPAPQPAPAGNTPAKDAAAPPADPAPAKDPAPAGGSGTSEDKSAKP